MKVSLIINVAYNDAPGFFEIFNNFIVKYPVYNRKGEYSSISYNFEILDIFFKNYDIFVNWINCYYTYGWYDDETRSWTGAVGKVEMKTFIFVEIKLTDLD